MRCTIKRFTRFIARPILFSCPLYFFAARKSLIPLQRDLIFHHCKSIDLNFHSARFKNYRLKMRKLRINFTLQKEKKTAKKLLRRTFFHFSSSVTIQTKRRINSINYVAKKRGKNDYIIWTKEVCEFLKFFSLYHIGCITYHVHVRAISARICAVSIKRV